MTLHEIINAKEGDHFEFKKAENRFDIDEGAKYLCAMSNYGGGQLVLGVTDKRPRKVVGSKACSQPERTVRYFMDKLHVRVDFEIYHDEKGNRVLVFEVASRPIGLPVQFEGIAWWRDGDSLVHMPETVRHEIYMELDDDFSSEICPDVTIDDLDKKAINKFRKKWRGHSGNKRLTSLTDEQLLVDCGAITDKGITYAALILFGKQAIIRKKLHHAEVIFEYRPREAAGPAAQREEFGAGFFTYNDRIWELVNLRNEDQYYKDGFYKHPVPSYYEDVVREGLLNAVSHREYRLGGGIFVRQYQNRLVIESPGGLPHGITVENILNRQNARNRLIADIFKLCGLVERSGQGMNLIYEMAIKDAKPLPDFSGSDIYFVMMTLTGQVISTDMLSFIKKIDDERLNEITIDDYLLLASLFTKKGLGSIDFTQFEHLVKLEIVRITENGIELVDGDKTFPIGTQSAVNRRSIGGQSTANQLSIDAQLEPSSDKQKIISDSSITNNITDSITKSITINDTQKIILAQMQKNPKTSATDLARTLGIADRNVKNHIKKLKQAGLLARVGSPKGGYWVVNENGVF